MLILNVPYNEKDDAKSLGARWNPIIKKWYVKDKKDYHKFIHWIEPYGNIVIIDELYLIEGVKKCFRCGKDTRVIGFGIDKHLSIDGLFEIENNNYDDNEIKEILYDKMLEINQDTLKLLI